MWLDSAWITQVNLDAFKHALQIFGDKIMPRDRALFGLEESPGIDCDPRIHILNSSSLMGASVGGFVSGVDQVTRQIRSDSNEKDIFYVNIEGSGGPDGNGADYYYGTLAHEFQHLITNKHDRNEDTWIDEGMSELAIYLNGYDTASDAGAATTPDIQFNSWPDGGVARLGIMVRLSRSCCTSGIATATRVCRRWPPKMPTVWTAFRTCWTDQSRQAGGRSGGRLADCAPTRRSFDRRWPLWLSPGRSDQCGTATRSSSYFPFAEQTRVINMLATTPTWRTA